MADINWERRKRRYIPAIPANRRDEEGTKRFGAFFRYFKEYFGITFHAIYKSPSIYGTAINYRISWELDGTDQDGNEVRLAIGESREKFPSGYSNWDTIFLLTFVDTGTVIDANRVGEFFDPGRSPWSSPRLPDPEEEKLALEEKERDWE